MQWTNGQQEALTLLSEWEKLDIYANPDDSIFTLSGAAGTGKAASGSCSLKNRNSRLRM